MSNGNRYSERFFSGSEAGSHRSAELILPIVLKLVRPQSVVDVGCGIGTWTRVLRRYVADVVGVDGEWVPASRDPEFVPRDLELPLDLGRRFDLAISMEVAEHLSSTSAERFVADLAALAPVVLFSAAIPHQGGVQHQNERWQSYWAGLFGRHGLYPHDVVRPRVWADPDVDPWYAQNALLYRPEPAPPFILDLVHPRHYLAALRWRTSRSRPQRLAARARGGATRLIRC